MSPMPQQIRINYYATTNKDKLLIYPSLYTCIWLGYYLQDIRYVPVKWLIFTTLFILIKVKIQFPGDLPSFFEKFATC